MKYIKQSKMLVPIGKQWKSIEWYRKRKYMYCYINAELVGKYKLDEIPASFMIGEIHE